MCCAKAIENPRRGDAAFTQLGDPLPPRSTEPGMITLGLVLLIIGFIAKIPILWSLGILLVVLGVIFELLGAAGRAVGGRRHYY